MFVYRIILTITLIAVMPNSVLAQQIWKYGDSTFQVNRKYGQSIEIIFEEPRVGLVAEGVARGTVLVTARGDGKKISGTSRLFRRDCGVLE